MLRQLLLQAQTDAKGIISAGQPEQRGTLDGAVRLRPQSGAIPVTRDEVVQRLRDRRAEFDALLAHIPANALEVPPPGRAHSPKQVAAHVAAYEDLIVERLRAARRGETTEFDRDRVGWEQFNERVWGEAQRMAPQQVLQDSARIFDELVAEIETLVDEDLNGETELTAHLDPGWLQGRTLAELLAIDGFDHYPMHSEDLKAAASR